MENRQIVIYQKLVVLILICVSYYNCFAQKSLRLKDKKIIHLGWEAPTTQYLKDSIALIEKQPFDGISILFKFPKHDVSICAFSPEPVKKIDIQNQLNDLKSISFNKLTDNFLLVFTADVSTIDSFDWFDDAQWKIIVENAELMSEIVDSANLKGIFFDTENYSGTKHPWVMKGKYSNNAILRAKVRERGKQFINALEKYKTDINILTTLFYGYLARDSSDQYSPLARYFFDGMLEELNVNSKIIDGVENHYWVNTTYQFPYLTNYTKNTVIDNGLVDAKLITKYRKQVGSSAGLLHNYIMSLDCNQAGIDCSNTLDSITQQKWLEAAVYNALINNDEYIWIYNQGESNWWKEFKNKQMSIDAIKSAKNKAMNEIPLGFTLNNSDTNKYNSKGFYIVKSSSNLYLNTIDSNRKYMTGNSISVNITSNDIYANYVRLYINGVMHSQKTTYPYFYNFDTLPPGNYEIYAIGYSLYAELIQSNAIFIEIVPKCSTTFSTININSCDSFKFKNQLYYNNTTLTDTLINSFGCDSILTMNLTVNIIDTAITQNGFMLTANSSNANYQWLDCNMNFSPILGEISRSFNPIKQGSYAVKITQNACADTSSCHTISNSGLTQIGSMISIEIYPNPITENKIQLSNLTSGLRYTSYSLYNFNGSKIEDGNFNGSIIELNAYLSTGMYFIKVQNNQNEIVNLKFIIE